jgi:integrase
MARQRRSREPRVRLTAPSGQTFTLVDRGERGWQLEATLFEQGRVRESVGRGSREEAARQAVERLGQLARAARSPDSPTITRAAAELIVSKEKAGHAEAYTGAMEGHLRNYILPHYGEETRVSMVKAAEHSRFKHILGEGDVELRTCNRVLTTLRQVFKYAEEKHYCEPHAFPRNFREDPQEAAERWSLLEPVEIGTLLAHADDDIRPILGFVANTGLRIGTALQTEAAWVDLRSALVHYPASAMKGRRAHTVELNDAAAEFLGQALEASPDAPFPFSYWYVARRWIAVRNAAGFPGVRIHDLRHSFVSNQLAAGTPIHVVRDMAAHRSLMVTALYAHHTDEARRAAARRVQITVGEKAEPAPATGTIDTRIDTKRKTQTRGPALSSEKRVGHPGLEPGANGLRIHCSTN